MEYSSIPTNRIESLETFHTISKNPKRIPAKNPSNKIFDIEMKSTAPAASTSRQTQNSSKMNKLINREKITSEKNVPRIRQRCQASPRLLPLPTPPEISNPAKRKTRNCNSKFECRPLSASKRPPSNPTPSSSSSSSSSPPPTREREREREREKREKKNLEASRKNPDRPEEPKQLGAPEASFSAEHTARRPRR